MVAQNIGDSIKGEKDYEEIKKATDIDVFPNHRCKCCASKHLVSTKLASTSSDNQVRVPFPPPRSVFTFPPNASTNYITGKKKMRASGEGSPRLAPRRSARTSAGKWKDVNWFH